MCHHCEGVPAEASAAPRGLTADNAPPPQPISLLRVQASLGPGCPQGDSLPPGACGTSRSPGSGESPSITVSLSQDAVSTGTQEATQSRAPEAAAGHSGG